MADDLVEIAIDPYFPPLELYKAYEKKNPNLFELVYTKDSLKAKLCLRHEYKTERNFDWYYPYKNNSHFCNATSNRIVNLTPQSHSFPVANLT